jgi:DNA-binding NtrC family response regulator
LKVVTIVLPRLAERGEDIPLLIEHFIRQFAKRHHKTIKSMSTAARRKLMAYDWPGNVRQLRNTIESMVVVDFDSVLDVDDLPNEFLDAPGDTETTTSNGVDSLTGASVHCRDAQGHGRKSRRGGRHARDRRADALSKDQGIQSLNDLGTWDEVLDSVNHRQEPWPVNPSMVQHKRTKS